MHRTYEIIDNIRDLARALEGVTRAALDFEGWHMVRLVQVCNDDVWFVCDFGNRDENWFSSAAHLFDKGQEWIAFFSKHELMCFEKYGEVQPIVWDVANLHKAIYGGGHLSLAKLLKVELGYEMDKEQQTSDWDTPDDLSDEQMNYAADDALYTWEVYRKLEDRATDGQMRAYRLLDDMTPAVMEMERNGIKLHVQRHRELIKKWEAMVQDREEKIRKLVPEDVLTNLNSGKQFTELMLLGLDDDAIDAWPKTEKTGRLSIKRKDLEHMSVYFGQDTDMGKFLKLMAERTTLNKYLSAFGETLIGHQQKGAGGRVHAHYNIAAAVTCRFSSSKPNLQQTPRDRDFFGERLSIRRGFVANQGNLLVSYDYSGIEMRVMALVSGDEKLLDVVINGDPHGVMAEKVLGRAIDKSNPEDKETRQQMKGVNFGIIYGVGALGLAANQGWTIGYAQEMLDTWADMYPEAWDYRNKMFKEARETGYITMVDGGTIKMDKKNPGLTKCANYPVQRAGLSVMARAIVRHHETLKQCPADVKLLSTIHDALIDEVPERMAQDVMLWMKRDMVRGFLDIFPNQSIKNLVEGGTGPSWGELEEA